MTRSSRWVSAAIGLLVLGAIGALANSRARAEEEASPPPGAGSWMFDVRVVRVDPVNPLVLESAPTWKPTGAAGATTTAAWSEVLAGLKTRGRTTILLDQRLTASAGTPAEFRQQRRRAVLSLATRAGGMDTWQTTYVESGTRGELAVGPDGLRYVVEAQWEEAPTDSGSGVLGSTSWKGSRSRVANGETLVLSYREQKIPPSTTQHGLEIYVFVTASLATAK